MNATIVKRILRLLPVFLALLVVFADAKPARAANCFQELRKCYHEAAGKAGLWERWAAGLDCELTLTDCTRRAILGR